MANGFINNDFTADGNITGTTLFGTTFDTNVAAAGITLSGTTLAADGTDANILITLTPKGTSPVYLNGKLGIGTNAVPHGAIGGALVALEGANASVSAGPHMQFTTASDDYPLMQIFPYAHNDMHYLFDSYYDGAFKSSSSSCNFRISKSSTSLNIASEEGIAAGSVATFQNDLIIDKAGYVNKPLQPAFCAYNSATDQDVTGDGTTYTLIYDTELYDQNSDYNNGTGTFTAPIGGKFLFTITTTLLSVNGFGLTTMNLVTSDDTIRFNYVNVSSSTSSNAHAISGSTVVDMDSADTAIIQINVSGGTKTVDVEGSGGTKSLFSGTMLC